MTKIHLILILCFLNVEITRNTTTPPTPTLIQSSLPATPEQNTCPAVNSSSFPVTWPSTYDKTPSQPPCVNQENEILYRECVYGFWKEEPECEEVQPDQAPLCPDGFEQIEDICYIVTAKVVFPPSCPFKEVLPFFKYIDMLVHHLEEPIWVPVVRDLSNGFDWLRWVEVSDFYKMELTDYDYNGTIYGKNCIVYDIPTERMMAVPCSEEHPAVCAYNQLNLIENKACKLLDNGCHQSDYSSKTTCFCVENGEPLNPRAEFIKPYQNSISLTNDVCNFGLQKSRNGTYYWVNSNREIDYTFWSPSEANFDSDHIYGAVTPNGWILTKSLDTCFITEEKVSELDVTLSLNFSESSNAFVLTVANPYWLQDLSVNCFTDASRSSLLSICKFDEIIDDNPDVFYYTFKPVEPFGGQYWCEAFKFSNSELVLSEKHFFQTSDYFEFVALFQVTIESFSYDLLNPHIMKVLNETVLTRLNGAMEDGTYYIARIMKIVSLDEENDSLLLNIHFSSILEVPTTTNLSQMEEQYNNLKSTISTLLHFDENIKMVNFSSSNFCMREVIYYRPDFYLTWPTRPAFWQTQPEEFCFRSDGNLVTNLCFGNFTEGFGWIMQHFDCQILKSSPLSKELLSLQQQTTITTDDMNRLLQMDVASFISSDMYLYAEICYKYFTTPNFDFEVFISALENVFKMNRRLLLVAQMVTHATIKMLYMVDNVMTVWQEPIQKVEEDFILLSTSFSDVSGIAVQLINGKREISILRGDCTVETVIKTENLELAIFLDPDLKNKSASYGVTKLAFSVFFNDALFGEQEFPTKKVTAIFEVLFLNESGLVFTTPQTLPGPVTIVQKMDLNDNMDVSCVAWMSDYIARGSWWEFGEYSNYTTYQVCKFWYTAHLAVATSWKEQNVTADLENLLNGDYFDTERINCLVNISQKYNRFNFVDVLLVGEVLDMVKNNTDNDLEMLAKIVDNLHRIDKPVLSQSQDEHHATDLILDNIDNILRNYNTDESELLITTDNFIVFVANLKTSNVSGLLLLKSNQTMRALVVRDNFTISNITSYHDFSSGVLLSPRLKNQWKNDSKIIITVFTKDALFNEDQTAHKDVSKIFGVILPENENYTYPIRILHNITTTKYSLECAHWNYSTNSQNKSYWKKDSDANSFSFISQCDFWHTTHFALLLTNSAQDIDYDVLDWIATVNSALSLLGLSGIVLTAILFEKWRRNIGNKILLNFSFAIIIQIVTFYLASTLNRRSDNAYCTLIGVLLHYSIISEFCWMLTIAILQFKRFVQVFVSSPKYLLLKTCVCGWVFPVLPVMLALVVDNEEYVMGDVGLCYPSGLGLYLGIWVPVGIIGTINLIIFIYITYSVFRKNVDSRSGRNDGKHQWRLFVLLFFMLGLTWMFGFLTGFSFGSTVFACLFCFTATLQGFVLFLYFIVFNVNTRYLYAQAFSKLLSRKTNK